MCATSRVALQSVGACSPGGVFVDSIGVVVIQALDALLQLIALGTLLNADEEQVVVGIQGELVHGVHASQVIQYKVQDGSTYTAGLVSGCSSLYLLCSGFRYLSYISRHL